LADGSDPPSKLHTRNYPTSGPKIDIALVAIPVIDIQSIIGIEVTNVGDVRAGRL